MQAIYLDPNQVPLHLRLGYSGKHFKAIPCDNVTIPFDVGLWSGGSREEYFLVRLSDGKRVQPVDHNLAPWDNARHSEKVTLQPGFMIVKSTMFQGKDLGLTFYVLPADIAPMLPKETEELTLEERQVLYCHGALISSARKPELQSNRFNMANYETVKASLIAKGMLDKRGAITVKGKNARGNGFNYPKE